MGPAIRMGYAELSRGAWSSTEAAVRLFEVLGTDPLVGKEVVALIDKLRNRRNAAAHVDRSPISSEEAKEYALRAEDIIWLLGRAQDVLEKRDLTWAQSIQLSAQA